MLDNHAYKQGYNSLETDGAVKFICCNLLRKKKYFLQILIFNLLKFTAATGWHKLWEYL